MSFSIDTIRERVNRRGANTDDPPTPEPYWKRGKSRERPFERLTHYRVGSLLAEYHATEFDENGMLRGPKITGWIVVGPQKTKHLFGDDVECITMFHSGDGKKDVTSRWLKNMLNRGLIRVEVY